MSFKEQFDSIKDCYFLEDHRLESFKTWPFKENSACTKENMAKAGFYWAGISQEFDTVTCFVCSKTLGSWNVTDIPWEEHAKHAPQCLFVKYGRPESELTVREFLEILGVVIKNKVLRDTEASKKELMQYATQLREQFNRKKV